MTEVNDRRVALITGASSGFGKDFAELFAADGHNVVLVARRRERLEAVADDLSERFGVECFVEVADLTKHDARVRLFDSLRDQGVAVDFLVNNAGFGTNGTFWELPLDAELAQVQVNIEALVHLTHLVLPQMVERGSGRVLNIGSTASFQPGPGMAVYYASKGFVLSFTEAIAHELRGTGVTATVHCPGAADTEFGEVSGNIHSNLFKKGSVASSMDVVRHAYRAMHAGKVVAVHGALNSIGAAGVRFTPRGLVRTIVAKINET